MPGVRFSKKTKEPQSENQYGKSQKLNAKDPRGIPPRDPPKECPGSPRGSPQGVTPEVSPVSRAFCGLIGCVDFVIIQRKQLNAYCHVAEGVEEVRHGIAKHVGEKYISWDHPGGLQKLGVPHPTKKCS
jgi:hypothetical protein